MVGFVARSSSITVCLLGRFFLVSSGQVLRKSSSMSPSAVLRFLHCLITCSAVPLTNITPVLWLSRSPCWPNPTRLVDKNHAHLVGQLLLELVDRVVGGRLAFRVALLDTVAVVKHWAGACGDGFSCLCLRRVALVLHRRCWSCPWPPIAVSWIDNATSNVILRSMRFRGRAPPCRAEAA